MSYEQIFGCTKKLESILSKIYKAEGKGLHSKLGSVEKKLPANIVKKCRFIATIRNKMAHREDFQFDEITKEKFTISCAKVDSFFKNEEKKRSEYQAKKRLKKEKEEMKTNFMLFILGMFLMGIMYWFFADSNSKDYTTEIKINDKQRVQLENRLNSLNRILKTQQSKQSWFENIFHDTKIVNNLEDTISELELEISSLKKNNEKMKSK